MVYSCLPTFDRVEQRIELAGLFERVKLVAAANVHRADKDLRKRGAAVRALHHLLAHLRIAAGVNLTEVYALARKKFFRPVTILARLQGIDFDRSHNDPLNPAFLIWMFVPGRQPGQTPARRRWRRLLATAPWYSLRQLTPR